MIDTHAHLHLIDMSTQDIIDAAIAAGVSHIVQVAIDEVSIDRNISEYQFVDCLSVTAGIHPLSVNTASSLDRVLARIRSIKDLIVAIGEIGLDYKYGGDFHALQKDWLIAQLDLASQLNLPVIIHLRYADDDMLSIVNQFPDVKKVFHCYSTNLKFYESLKGDLNYVSFTGMITFSKKGKVIQAVRSIPIEKIMIETDAPYLVPQKMHPNQNQPAFIVEIAKKIAMVKDISVDEVSTITTKNAIDFFSLTISNS